MTNEQLFDDLKQFIATAISQQTVHLATKNDITASEQRLIKGLTSYKPTSAKRLTKSLKRLT